MKSAKIKILAVFTAVVFMFSTTIAPAAASVQRNSEPVKPAEIIDDLGEVILIEPGVGAVGIQSADNPTNPGLTPEEIKEVEELAMELGELFVELDGLVRALGEAVVAEYIQLELQELETAVEQLELRLEAAGKDAEFIEELEEILEAAEDKNEGILEFIEYELAELIEQGQEALADAMLNERYRAMGSLLGAFVHQVEKIQADQRLGQKEAVDLVRQAQDIMAVIKGERAKALERVPEMVKRQEVALETWREIEQVVAETRQITTELQARGAWFEIEVEGNLAFIVAVVVKGVAKKGVGKVAKTVATHKLTKRAVKAITVGVVAQLPGVVELDPTTADVLTLVGVVGALLSAPTLTTPLMKRAVEAHFGIRCMAYVAFTWIEGQVWAAIITAMGRKLDQLDLSVYYQKVSQTIDRAPGMHQYRWFNQDFGWTHTIELPPGKKVGAASLRITAWNVDWGVEPYWEHDLVTADGFELGVLTGANTTTSTTTFILPVPVLKALQEDGKIEVFVDIDSNHNFYRWAVTIKRSELTVFYYDPAELAGLVI
ncbi:hypothetical protein M1N12_02685 [Peptococcaceae bacterium]|nr:hypothetical protein [Peptococcaceae bacterium]